EGAKSAGGRSGCACLGAVGEMIWVEIGDCTARNAGEHSQAAIDVFARGIVGKSTRRVFGKRSTVGIDIHGVCGSSGLLNAERAKVGVRGHCAAVVDDC